MFSPAEAEMLLKRLLLPLLHQEDDLYRSLPLPVALNGLDGNEAERQAVLSPSLLRKSAVRLHPRPSPSSLRACTFLLCRPLMQLPLLVFVASPVTISIGWFFKLSIWRPSVGVWPAVFTIAQSLDGSENSQGLVRMCRPDSNLHDCYRCLGTILCGCIVAA